MSTHDEDLAAAAAQFALEPGKVQLAAQALGERENAQAYGNDTSGPDKVLKGLGFAEAAQRRRAAARAAAKASGDEPGERARPPAGRKTPAEAKAATGAAKRDKTG